MTATPFAVGDRVTDRKGRIGTLEALRRHTNNSPRWVVRYDDDRGRYLFWQVDLTLAKEGAAK